MHRRIRILLVLLVASAGRAADPAEEEAERLARIKQEASRLATELEDLAGRERGILGELERLEGELRLREAEHQEVSQRLSRVSESIGEHDRTLVELEATQRERRDYLKLRLRAVYKSGPDQLLRQFTGGEEVDAYWSGVSYAALLSERDGAVLRAYRLDAGEIRSEREELQGDQEALRDAEAEAGERQDRLDAARRERRDALERTRKDQELHREALEELEAAAAGLTHVVDALAPTALPTAVDVHKFKGLLEWPTTGRLSAGFGSQVDPGSRTAVPHPGWDIEAPRGTDIVTIFDGKVVRAGWMRGYGLTVIIDHGNDVVSIYAHASALVVQEGEAVRRGQLIGQVGDTGSLRGEFLYFELRVGGRPVDPRPWLRPR